MATSPWLGGMPPTNPAPQLPAPPQLEALLAQVQALPEDPAFTQLTPDERVAWLQNLRKLVDVTESVFLQCLGDFDAQGDAQTLNAATTTAGWLRGSVGLAPGDANERARIARGLRNHLRDAGEALQSGEVSYEQVRAIEHAVRRIPESDQAAATSLLTDLARASDVMAVRTAGEKLKHTVDPDGVLRIVEKDFERRHLYMSPLLDGMTHVDGLLDPESAAIVSSALAPFLTPTDRDDRRSTAQRRADGLVSLASSAMAQQEVPTQSGSPTQLQVLVPVEGLPQLADAASSAPYLTTLGMARLGCAATVTRIVLGPESVPLDVGRTQRLFTPSQQLALSVRDGGCRFPGCSLPPRYTDAHHIVSWLDGGGTDLSNGVLLCRHHHRRVHEGGWEVGTFNTQHNTVTFLSPDGRAFVSAGRSP